MSLAGTARSRLRVCLAGAYKPEYTRIDVIVRGLEANGVVVDHARVQPSSPFKRRWRMRKLLRSRPIEADIVLVPAFCHHEVEVVRRFFRGPLVFDPLISRHLSKIHDYRSAGRYSVHAVLNHRVDRRALHVADYVLADTEAHKRYYVDTYRVAADKVFVVPVGYDGDKFRPTPLPDHRVATVGFYGSFIPLHGVETILAAAELLQRREDIRFELIGSGPTHAAMAAYARERGLENVDFLPRVPYAELGARISAWDVCLGIFGQTLKADLVIPNKIYHYAACARPMVTKDTPAIRELFRDEHDVLLCPPDPRALAERIERLMDDRGLAAGLAQQAHATVADDLDHVGIGRMIAALFDRWR